MNPNGEYGLKEYKASFVHPVTPEQLEKFASSHKELVNQNGHAPTIEIPLAPSSLDDEEEPADIRL